MADARSTLIIVPTYNEKENVGPLATAVLAEVPGAALLFVDDNSPDGTGQLVDQMAQQDPRIHVLHRPGKMGLGTAYIAGFRWGLEHGYAFICEMDADFSHDPRAVPALVEAARSGADVALGSRYIPGGGTVNWGALRKLISSGGNVYARTVLGVAVRDMTGGFKCFRRQVLETIDLDAVRSEGYAFQIELTYRALRQGFVIREVPITFVDRRVGKSKMSRKIFMEALWMVWRLRLGSL